MRRLPAVVAFFASCLAAQAGARPFTVDDFLRQESIGAVELDPSGRWLVYEHRARYDSAERYDYATAMGDSLSRLEVVDLGRPPAPRSLLPANHGNGTVFGAFSPSGRRLAIHRLKDRAWSLGIVTLESGAVRWFDFTPLAAQSGRTFHWLSDNEFLVIARGDRDAPRNTRRGWILAERLPALWAAAAKGASSQTVLGSGIYASVRPRARDNRLLRVSASTGAARVLAEGELFDFEVAPGYQHVALMSAGRDIQAHGAVPVRGPAGSETEVTELTLLDLSTGVQTSPCRECDVSPQSISWSPDGQHVLALIRGEDGLWTSGHLSLFDASGSQRMVGEGLTLRTDLNPVRIWTTWLENEPIVLGRPSSVAGGRDDWFRLSTGGPVNLTGELPPPDAFARQPTGQHLTVLADSQLWTVARDGSRVAQLAKGVAVAKVRDREVARSRPGRAAPEALWFESSDANRNRLSELRAGRLQGFTVSSDTKGDLVAASLSGRAAIRRETDHRGIVRLWLLRPDRPAEAIVTLNGYLESVDAPLVRSVRHRGRDGEALTSWLFLPAPASTERPPLIVRPYVGANHPIPPRDAPVDVSSVHNLRLLTSHGYAVLVPSLPNPPGGMTDPADGLADRILDIVAAAARDPDLGPRFDEQRLALWGFSFGGYSVMTTITQTARFRAAVAISGISDLVAYWASLTPGSYLDPESGYVSNWHTGGVELTQPRMLGPPWREPDRYHRNSPLLAADRIETPLLLVHGATDPIPHAGSEAMYSALFRQGKDALLVTYWGELHGLTSPGNIRDHYQRAFRFLDERLNHSAPSASAD